MRTASGDDIKYNSATAQNHINPRSGCPLYQCPSPGITLRISAINGRQFIDGFSHIAFGSGAPHSLQKLASATTTALPHCEQNRGRCTRVSGIEGEPRVA
jgi:hypothetical protein